MTYMNNSNNSSSSSKGNKRDFEISKYLSTVLRHRAEEMNLPIRHDGYLPVDDLLKLQKLATLHTTFDDIQRVVAENNKSRFHLLQEGGVWLIRANQGHSMANLDVDMKEITLEQAASYPEVIHGTYKAAWELIKQSGLNRMARVHIHCATGLNAKALSLSLSPSLRVCLLGDDVPPNKKNSRG